MHKTRRLVQCSQDKASRARFALWRNETTHAAQTCAHLPTTGINSSATHLFTKIGEMKKDAHFTLASKDE